MEVDLDAGLSFAATGGALGFGGTGCWEDGSPMVDIYHDFAHLVAETVFEPHMMADSVFDSLPQTEWYRTASGHRPDGSPLPGQWHTYPEMGAGPLWSTPSDMARFGIEVMLAYNGESDRVITKPLAREMLTPVANDYGLGFEIGDDGGNRLYATHKGANEGVLGAARTATLRVE